MKATWIAGQSSEALLLEPTTPPKLASVTVLLNMVSTLFMAGLIWFVQVVHYPLFDGVGRPVFARYETRHSSLTTRVVLLPMVIELLSATLLVWRRPAFISSWEAWVGFALVGVIWLSTALLQVPQHSLLTAGFNEAAHKLLVKSNWLRTVAWTLRALLVTWWLSRLLT